MSTSSSPAPTKSDHARTHHAKPALGQFEILALFKRKGIDFLDSLIEIFPEQSDLIAGRILITDTLPIEEILRKFGARFIPHAEMVRTRNEKFFLSNDHSIFSGTTNERVYSWKQLWSSQRLDAEDRLTIWLWVELFLNLSTMYLENERREKESLGPGRSF